MKLTAATEVIVRKHLNFHLMSRWKDPQNNTVSGQITVTHIICVPPPPYNRLPQPRRAKEGLAGAILAIVRSGQETTLWTEQKWFFDEKL